MQMQMQEIILISKNPFNDSVSNYRILVHLKHSENFAIYITDEISTKFRVLIKFMNLGSWKHETLFTLFVFLITVKCTQHKNLSSKSTFLKVILSWTTRPRFANSILLCIFAQFTFCFDTKHNLSKHYKVQYLPKSWLVCETKNKHFFKPQLMRCASTWCNICSITLSELTY